MTNDEALEVLAEVICQTAFTKLAEKHGARIDRLIDAGLLEDARAAERERLRQALLQLLAVE